MSKLTRREARTCAVLATFCASFHGDEDKSELFELMCSESEIQQNGFAKSLYFGACEHLSEIDAAISSNSKGWKIERISKMSLAVLRVAVYELLFTETPPPIVINEALEIDKIYDKDDAPAFINGILNAVAKSNPRN